MIKKSIRKLIKGVASTSDEYRLSEEEINHFTKYSDLIKIGLIYRKSKHEYSIRVRPSDRRVCPSTGKIMSPGDYYKNTIFAAINDQPSYDGYGEWLDTSIKKQDPGNFFASCKSLNERIPKHSNLVMGSNNDNGSDFHVIQSSELKKSIYNTEIESFGNDSSAQISSLVNFSTKCFEKTGKPILIFELGPGIGYWINKVGMILGQNKVPFKIITFELFFFNSLNTLRMSKYFGNEGKVLSINCDIDDFDWVKFANANNKLLSKHSIVIHSSGCIDPYIKSETIYEMIMALSQYDLYGGCHNEGDGFTLMNNSQKSTFLKAITEHFPNILPEPARGLRSFVQTKKNIHHLSYLDPCYSSSLIKAINELSIKLPLAKRTIFPWSELHSSPSHYTTWKITGQS